MSHDHRRVSVGRIQVHWGEMAGGPHRALEHLDDEIRRNRLRRNPMQLHMREVLLEDPGTLRFSVPRLPRIILSSDPLFGESFCMCYKNKGHELPCVCGENDSVFDWVWDNESRSSATQLQNENREVRFHTEYSCGTAAVRGNQPMLGNQYFWEIKMTTPVYGTDMMVGVGTDEADLNRGRNSFCSLLGSDCESWGLSYTGLFYHEGKAHCYAPRFGQGSIIGIHLDMWNGTLSFYKNRHSLGVACTGLKGKTLYPMVSSTAARSGMKVIRSRSFNSSLQYLCCLKLRQIIPSDLDVLQVVSLPPGLSLFLQNNLGWLLGPATTSVAHCCHCRSSKENLQKVSCHSRAPDVCNNSSTHVRRTSNADSVQAELSVDSGEEKSVPHFLYQTEEAESSVFNTNGSSVQKVGPQQPSSEEHCEPHEILIPVKRESQRSAEPNFQCVATSTSTETNPSGLSADYTHPPMLSFASRSGQSAKRKYSSSSSSEESIDHDDEVMESEVSMFKRHPHETL